MFRLTPGVLEIKYLLFSVLGMLLGSGCDGGSSSEPPFGFGNSGPVVNFSAGCGEQNIWCADDDDIKWTTSDEGIPEAICAWDCAIYTGKEKVTNLHGAGGPAPYIVVFRMNPQGCWELLKISRLIPTNC